jgi:hypothetical protein
MIHKKWLAMAVISTALSLVGYRLDCALHGIADPTHALNAPNSEKL